LDYQNARDQQEDSARKVTLAADRLRPQLDLVAHGALNSPPKNHGVPLPEIANYDWDVGATVDLPLERKAERNAYRAALIAQLQFWDNMGILYIKEDGQWEEMEETPRGAGTSQGHKTIASTVQVSPSNQENATAPPATK